METMTAAYLPGNSTVELRTISVPKPGIGQVLIKMKASGICGSDIHYIYHKHVGSKEKGTAYLDVVAGHEPSGEVVELGQACRHYRVGDRVIVYHISGCGHCTECKKGYQISCTSPQRKAYGWQRDGGHAEFLVADEKDLVPLPDSLSYRDGCFISCGVGTAFEAILRSNVSGSDSVLVVGLGPVGMAAMMLARGRGARLVVGVDLSAERVRFAESLDIMNRGLVVSEDTLEAIREITGGGANVAIDCSGNPKGRLLALQGSARWGRIVYLGETGPVTFDVSDDLMHMQRTLMGSWVTSLSNMERCANDLDAWGLHPHAIISHTYPLARAAEAYERAAAAQSGKAAIVFE